MTLSVAIIGAGNISTAHLGALKEARGAEVVGIYDQDGNRARERAAEYGVGRVYGAWEELLGDPGVQCVAVLLPHDLHERFAVDALNAGKHVVCEKPLGQSVAECDRMLAAAERAGKQLLPVHNRVYDDPVERIAEILQSGGIGEVFLAQTNGYEGPGTVGVRPWLGTRRGGGGVLLAQAVHPAYILRWLLGDVAKVSCLFGDRKVVDMTNEDTAVAVLKFRNGALAEMSATFGIAHGPFDHSIQLHGREGYLHLTSNRGPNRQSQPFLLEGITPRLFGDTELHPIELPASGGWQQGFVRLWEDYARGLTEGAPTRVTGDDGKRAVEIIVSAYESQETGKTVEL
ncbi:MAG TPA: Gfo/Idh/MocA family oxidoreductase [Chloroflexota bacterium]|nr:Gfo/Idh/MocA family oxidoreductase [Chloroflexota bacterium]